MAAAFRSVGIDATVTPDSTAETLELGGLHTSGEECLPHKVTVGDFLRVCKQPGFDPARTAFLMPTAHGPCRFGQYGPYLRMTLDELGYGDVMILAPTSGDGYGGFGEQAADLMKTGWLAMVLGDLAVKFLLKTRPYEKIEGDAEALCQDTLAAFENILELQDLTTKRRVGRLVEAVERMRDQFRCLPAHYEKGRPLIGVVGEIFCRLNTFSNDDVLKRIERCGGECWLSDIAEWVWYTNWGQAADLRESGGRLSADWLKLKIKTHLQHKMEQAMLEPVATDLVGYEEPHDIREVLNASRPYLPPEGCLGEMVLSVGKSVYLHGKGVDGVLDVSPFTCMNGVICEAVYPSLSADHDNLPIRSVYMDGNNTDIDSGLEIFLDLAGAYQRRKRIARRYPAYFDAAS